MLFTWVPFVHNDHGETGVWCYVRDKAGVCTSEFYLEGFIEQFTLWYGPLFVCLTIIIIVATIIIVLVLLWRNRIGTDDSPHQGRGSVQ